MYKNVCHKIIVYVLVGCLSFGVPATTYYKSVHAIEYLGGALAFEEALKWLLAIVGVTAAGSVASQVDWSEVREQCVEVQLHNGASQAQVSEWWANLARGTVDKASSCWDSFLEWSDSLVDSSSGGGSSGVGTISSLYNDYCSSVGINPADNVIATDGVDLNATVYASTCFYPTNRGGMYMGFYIVSGTYSLVIDGNYVRARLNGNNISSGQMYYLYQNTTAKTVYLYNAVNYDIINNTSNYSCFYYGFGSVSNNNLDSCTEISSSGSGVIDSDWQSAIDVARENLNLLNRDLPDENSSEVAIPLPGLADSDNEVSADVYDNIVDAINDGTITLDDGIAQIQDLLHVLVIDDTTDIVQPVRPDPDTGEDQTKEDVIKENKSNMGFTLAGLEKVFPFCIPFDIYAFLTLLVAEPVAPEFDFPVKSVNNQTEEIHIDLSPFEPVAVVVRYIFDFLFIIGLALMTRSLIGGGSSD